MSRGTPGDAGIAKIVGGVVGVGVLMTVMFGDWAHWIPIGLFILVSLLTVRRIKR